MQVDFLKKPERSFEFESSLMFPVMSEPEIFYGYDATLPQYRLVSVSTNSFIKTVTGAWELPSSDFYYFNSLCFFICSGERIMSNNLMLRNPGNCEYYDRYQGRDLITFKKVYSSTSFLVSPLVLAHKS